MRTIITGFKLMLNDKKHAGAILYLQPVEVNGRVIKSFFCTDWKLLSESKVTVGSKIELITKFDFIDAMAGVVARKENGEQIDATVCPVCGKTLQQAVGGKERFCVNERCGHSDMIRMWKLLKYCYYLTDLKFSSIYIMYTKHDIKTLSDLYRIRELVSEAELVSTPILDQIANALDSNPTVKLSNLYYSLIPDMSIYTAYRLSMCKTWDWKHGVSDINVIDGVRVDDDKLGSLHSAAGDLKSYLLSPQVKPQMKILAQNIIVDMNIDLHLQDRSFRILRTNRISTVELSNLIKLAGGKCERNTARLKLENIDYWVGTNVDNLPASVEINKFIHEDELLEILTYRPMVTFEDTD